jgi:hypothetical protein
LLQADLATLAPRARVNTWLLTADEHMVAEQKKKIITFEGQMLLSPTHDDVDVIQL